jgi:outer membrane immunogenic protein
LNARKSVESQMSNHSLGATMRTLLLGAVASVALLAGPAIAADLPMKARPIAPIAPSWTGFYVGLNAGGSFGSDTATQNATFTSTALGANGLLSNTAQHAPKGWLAGGQLGYNWQVSSSYVLGLEADWQWTSQKAAATSCTPPASLNFFGAGANGLGWCSTTQEKLTSIGTARARGHARQ